MQIKQRHATPAAPSMRGAHQGQGRNPRRIRVESAVWSAQTCQHHLHPQQPATPVTTARSSARAGAHHVQQRTNLSSVISACRSAKAKQLPAIPVQLCPIWIARGACARVLHCVANAGLLLRACCRQPQQRGRWQRQAVTVQCSGVHSHSIMALMAGAAAAALLQ